MVSSEPLRQSELPRASFTETALALALRKRPQEHAVPRDGLRPRLTALDLTFIGVGASVGSGIFVVVGLVVHPTGPAVCISFLIAAITSIFSAFCFAELAARIPVSGSVYLYAYVVFGEFWAMLCGFNMLMDFHVGAALSTVSCAAALHQMLQSYGFEQPWDRDILTVLLLLSLTLLLCMGVESGLKRANGLLVTAKVTIVLMIIVVGFGKMEGDNLVPFMPSGLAPVASQATVCCFSYIGFGTVASAAEECVKPSRDLPVGITASLLLCGLLYVAFAIVLCGLVPYQEIDQNSPVTAAFGPRYANIPWMNELVSWGTVLGIYTTLITGLYSQARIYLAMARDGLVSARLKYVSARFGTPVVAQLLCSGISLVLVLTLPLERLANFLNIGVLSSYTVVCAGVLVLRADEPAATAAASAVLAAVSLASALLMHWVATSNFFADRLAVQVVLYCVAIGGVAASWVPLFRRRYSVPTTFACPLCPLIPILGITVNGCLLSQCKWEAWLRLGVTSALIILGYSIRALQASRLTEPCFGS